MSWRWDGPIITFVIPWYGPEVPGGAELQCRRTAEELCARGVATEVFTTTAGGLATDWGSPAFTAGVSVVNGVRVHRFPVRARDAQAFEMLNGRLLHGERLSLLEETVFVREIIGSDALEQAIADSDEERIFIFIPYMFGTSYWGARRARKAYFIPCLHNECYAYMTLYRQLLESAYGLFYNSPAEQRLAQRLYRLDNVRQLMLGEGVDMDSQGVSARFCERYGIEEPFLLYVGRRDVTKNTPLLFEYFRRYRQEGGGMRLVCIGGPGLPLPQDLLASGAATDLGFLTTQDKYDAYAAATVLCQPSLNESFSLVMMEAWSCGTPALVHSDCQVTREFCVMSGGGLHFRSCEEFVGSLDWLQEHPELARQMGGVGRRYVWQQFNWDAVLKRLLLSLHNDGVGRYSSS